MSESRRITYTSTATDPEFRVTFDRELARVRARFPIALGGNVGFGPVEGLPEHLVVSPIDLRLVVARVAIATPGEVEAAVGFAHSAFPRWRALAWQRRVEIVRDAAERIAARNLELAAWMVWEVGKTRLEAMAEVEESADLLRYYAERMESQQGYRRPLARMSPAETTESVLLPYGVWAVVSPFNFPSALAAGMIAGALLGGNTVVFKPALDAPISGELLCEAFWDAGLPRDALQLVHGPGSSVGETLLAEERVAGVAFTGSSEVGMRIVRRAAEGTGAGPCPVVVEMGGKNAAPRSSPPRPTSMPPPRRSRALLSASAGRSAAPARASTSSARWPNRFSTGSFSAPRRCESATRPPATRRSGRSFDKTRSRASAGTSRRSSRPAERS
jgi:1-pyrroline-5-carboxylate dehydrogenase